MKNQRSHASETGKTTLRSTHKENPSHILWQKSGRILTDWTYNILAKKIHYFQEFLKKIQELKDFSLILLMKMSKKRKLIALGNGTSKQNWRIKQLKPWLKLARIESRILYWKSLIRRFTQTKKREFCIRKIRVTMKCDWKSSYWSRRELLLWSMMSLENLYRSLVRMIRAFFNLRKSSKKLFKRNEKHKGHRGLKDQNQ